MIAPTHYRSLLSPPEQDVYKSIVTGLLQHRDVICIGQAHVQADAVRKIVRAVHFDHPELFHVDFWHYQLTRSPLSHDTSLRFHMLLDASSSKTVANSLNAKATSLQEIAQKSLTREEAYFLIAKEITSTTKYNDTNSAFWDHTVAGPILCHSAVCEGIAKLFLFLCQRFALPCAIIAGTLNGVPHAWNMVELNEVRKYVDITAALQTISIYSVIPKAFFKSEQYLRRNGYNW